MASPVSSSPIATASQRVAVFVSLEAEWRHLLRSPGLPAAARAWAAAEPALRGDGACPGDVTALVTWLGYRPSAEGALVLSALLRLAPAPLAARALLQALLPRIRAERVHTAGFGHGGYGHGGGEAWPRPGDTAADLVAECFAAIARHAGEDRQDVDRLIVGEAARRLRTARQWQRRYQRRTTLLAEARPGGATSPSGKAAGEYRLAADISSARSSAEWLASALVETVRAGGLSVAQARLLYGARVKGMPASEVGRAYGLAPKAVYHALACAERAFLAYTAGTAGRAATAAPWAA